VPPLARESALEIIDWLIIAAYFVFVIWLGSHFGKKQTKPMRDALKHNSRSGH